MFKSILVPIDLADTDLAKPAIATAVSLSQASNGTIRLLNVLQMTPVMLAEYVPADFDVQQRQSSEDALAIVARATAIGARATAIGAIATAIVGCDEPQAPPPAPTIDPPVVSSALPPRRPTRRYYLARTSERCEIFSQDGDDRTEPFGTPCPEYLRIGERIRQRDAIAIRKLKRLGAEDPGAGRG